MEIIDAHAHIFPQKIAAKAVQSIGAFYDIPMDAPGAAENLLESMKEADIDRSLVCSVATKPEQVRAINAFLEEQGKLHPEFIPFAAMHPHLADIEEEFAKMEAAGFYGIKLHPDFQAFDIDDPSAMEMYRLAEGKFPILFHTGDNRYDWSKPYRLARIMEKFPDLVCIAAHFGGYRCWDEAFDVYKGGKLYMDTSSALMFIDNEKAHRFIDQFGADHFFFGTDFPMWTHKEEIVRFESLGLDEETKKAIYAENFKRVIIRKEI